MFVRVNITLPDDVLASLDAAAQRSRTTRSGFIRDAVFDRIDRDARPSTGGDLAREVAAPYAPVARRETDQDATSRLVGLLTAFFHARDDVRVAWLSGSHARGEARSTSDVDVAVLLSEELDGAARSRVRIDLMSRLPGAIGVRQVDVIDVAHAARRQPALAYHATVGGIVVLGLDHPARAELEYELTDAYLDMRPLRDLYNDAFLEAIELGYRPTGG